MSARGGSLGLVRFYYGVIRAVDMLVGARVPAVAQWSGDSLTVWTGTQRPFGVRSELASAFRIREDQVRVLMPGERTTL